MPFWSKLSFSPPSMITLLSTPVFLLASGIQHDCHSYLASLTTYTLPIHPIFQSIVCPHYTAECLLYLSLAFVAAPPGQILNRTILSAFVFVITNLGVTAASTREFYAQKFGHDQIATRWTMIPFVW